MNAIFRAFKYVHFYLKADTKELRQEAFDSAKKYYAGKQITALEFQAYQRGFKNQRCREAATNELNKTTKLTN